MFRRWNSRPSGPLRHGIPRNGYGGAGAKGHTEKGKTMEWEEAAPVQKVVSCRVCGGSD